MVMALCAPPGEEGVLLPPPQSLPGIPSEGLVATSLHESKNAPTVRRTPMAAVLDE